MKTLLLAGALAALTLGAAPALAAEALTAEKKADIERLIDTTGAMGVGRQMSTAMIGQIIGAVRKAHPQIPKDKLDALAGIVNAVIDENTPSFKQQVVSLYHKYFDHAEVKQLMAFYSTDLGKKAVRVMPALVQEGMEAGRQWGQSLGPEIERRVRAQLKKEGYDM